MLNLYLKLNLLNENRAETKQEFTMSSEPKKFKILILTALIVVTLPETFISQNIKISPQPAYLGTIPLGYQLEAEIIVYNLTSNNVTINNIKITGPSSQKFTVINSPSPTIPPISSIYLYIAYSSSSIGKDIAILEITTNLGVFTDTLIAQTSLTQNNVFTFERITGTIGDQSGDDSPLSIKKTSDGGYIIVGSTLPPDENYSQILVLKVDQLGKTQWLKLFGGNYSDYAYDVLEVQDGYIIAGSSDSYGTGSFDVLIVKIDKYGNLLWMKNFQSQYNENAYRMISINDGFLICGDTQNTPDRSTDALVIKVDLNGQILWKRNYGGRGGEIAYDIKPTGDGNYILSGAYSDPSTGKSDVLIFTINSSGDLIWSKNLGGSEDDLGYKISKTNNGYIIAGFTASYGAGGRDAFLVKIDNFGNPLWYKTFGTSHNDEFTDLILAENGDIIAVGYINQYFSLQFIYNDIFVIRTDSNGNLIWQTKFGGQLNESGSQIITQHNGGYILLGTTKSYAPKQKIYLIGLNEQGKLTAVADTYNPRNFELSQNYPNPFNSQTHIYYKLGKQSVVILKIYNVAGKLVLTPIDTKLQYPGTYFVTIDFSGLPSGLYLCELTAIDPADRKILFKSMKKMLFIK